MCACLMSSSNADKAGSQLPPHARTEHTQTHNRACTCSRSMRSWSSWSLMSCSKVLETDEGGVGVRGGGVGTGVGGSRGVSAKLACVE